ncbi:hypothetical protein PQ455_01370 [Sphingomonas naphthae]|uniref:Uncharacterized protein n=1 Tax=Sphingomonas naphthae TaxID=1813468 RepID=A0ABY7TLR1_9SPHN|nr:hypothetical protein [Sphingomonas naphthae]WCT73911.1 hypothetical protein PQ455_01370 [Sphingomonas naphthae]
MDAAALIAAKRAAIAYDADLMARRPEGCPRAAWRMENTNPAAIRLIVRDTKLKTQPQRVIVSDATAQFEVKVYGDKRLIESIDLRAADAEHRLARYMPA